jgi:hypothetical protein
MALLLVPGVAAAQEQPPPRTISVSAQGTIEREPEQGVVLLAVESEAQTARAAAEDSSMVRVALGSVVYNPPLITVQKIVVLFTASPPLEPSPAGSLLQFPQMDSRIEYKELLK